MFTKEIKFIASKEYMDCAEVFPQPSKLNIPVWYKELNYSIESKTIKGCMPFLDTLTAGYTIKMPVDYYIGHNVKKEGERYTEGFTTLNSYKEININVKNKLESHSIGQLGEKCPFVNKNKSLPFHKILNPWTIKTPPGYSCLFLPPMNNSDDRFSIIPGIVDTDTFPYEINFPIIINGDKYPVLETTIKIGTPFVQVIPFKREKWKMKIITKSPKEGKKNMFALTSKILENYKTKWWSKKSWK
tara:strand:- start:1011 stop:1742 length:732 start_codon:yes stop_codon:yes gene_type:complete